MIAFEQISKRYGATQAVDALSLELPAGSLVALTGPNGAGKTTLIRMLLGLTRPDAGVARVAGYDVQRQGVQARQQLGYLPQRPLLYKNLTVLENLRFVAQLRQVAPLRCGQVLSQLQLSAYADRPARELSGGMLQRLGLGLALLADPPVLVLDEPTVSLDPQSTAVFKTLLRELHAAGKTILYSSHLLSDVQELAGQVALLDRGRLVAYDTVAGLARRCELPERLALELATVAGHEAEVARQAGASEIALRGSCLELAVPPTAKLHVLRQLLAAGVSIRDFHSQAPTLEAIVLQMLNRAGAVREPPLHEQ